MPDVFDFKETLQAGIRRTSEATRNSQALISVEMLKPTLGGGMGLSTTGLSVMPAALTASLFAEGIVTAAGETATFPFPQILRGRDITYVGGEDYLYVVDESDWSLQEVHPIVDGETDVLLAQADLTDRTDWDYWPVFSTWVDSGVDVFGGTSLANTAGAGSFESLSAPFQLGHTYVVYINIVAGTPGAVLTLTAGTVTDTVTVPVTGTGWVVGYLPVVDGPQLNVSGTGAGTRVARIAAYEPTAIPSGGVWHLADFGPVTLLFNGSCTVITAYRFNEDGVACPVTYIDTTFAPATGCNYRGRLVTGGFDYPDYNDTYLPYFLAAVSDAAGADKDNATSLGMGVTGQAPKLTPYHVWWSSIGGADMLMHYFPDMVLAGKGIRTDADWDSDDNVYLSELITYNQQGQRRLPWKGEVKCLKPYKEGVMVYTSAGVGLLQPIAEPYPTFGFTEVSVQGVSDRGAVCGGEDEHFFVDSEAIAWRFSAEGLQLLGGEELLLDLLDSGTGLAISYLPKRREYFVSGYDGAAYLTYIFNPTGIGQSGIVPTSLVLLDGAWCVGPYVNAIDGVSLITDTVDMAGRSSDTISMVEVGATANNLMLTIYYRFQTTDDWLATTPVAVPRTGRVRKSLTCCEFRLKLSCATFTDFTQLDYIRVHFANTGTKRSFEDLLTL